MSCVASENLICKHVRSTKTFYVDLDNQLQPGVTIVSASADPVDPAITVESVSVVSIDTVIHGDENCADVALIADRAVLITLSGGTPSNDETVVTLEWTQSDGDEDSRELRLSVGGTA